MNNHLATLRKGAVTACFFPLAEAPNHPGPVARPALVVHAFFDRTDMIWKAIVAYGTSRRTRANMGFEVRLTRDEGIQSAGLTQPTRFTLSRMRILPFDERYFDFSSGDSPILGYLDDGLMAHLEKTCDRLYEVAQPLRPLASLPAVRHSLLTRAEQEPSTTDISASNLREIDRYMRKHMTGDSRLHNKRRRA